MATLDEKQKSKNLACLERLLIRCEQTEFYGKITFVVKRGEIKLVEADQTIRPEDILNNTSGPIQLPGLCDGKVAHA